jgi:hypothetical protein
MWDVLCLDAFLLLMELDWCRTLKGSWGEDRDVNQSCLRLLAASCCCFFIWFADIFGCMMLLSAFALRQFRGSSCQIRHASCVRDLSSDRYFVCLLTIVTLPIVRSIADELLLPKSRCLMQYSSLDVSSFLLWWK